MSGITNKESFFEDADVSRETMEKISLYAKLLEKWQKQINLIGPSTVPDLWNRHFYDSYQLVQLIELSGKAGLKFLDIGSGAGFPGLLLSILGLGEFHMVESNNKKCAFMRQVIRETGCNAIVHNARIESLPPFRVDYIVSRACAPLDKLLDLGRAFIQEHTECLFLKGQNVDLEMGAAQKKWQFDVKKHTSKSEESGIILKISHIRALH